MRSLLVTQASKVAARGSTSCLKFLVVVLFQRLIFLPSHVESVRAQLHRGPVRHARLDVGLAHVPLGEDFLVLYGFVSFDILGQSLWGRQDRVTIVVFAAPPIVGGICPSSVVCGIVE